MSDQHDYQGTGKNGKNADSIQSVTKAQAAFSDGLANGWIVPDGNGGFKAGRQDSGFDAFMSKFVPLATAAGLGAAFGPALLGAVGVPATTAAGGATLAGGVTSGAITGASGAALTGKNIAKGAVLGGLGGGLTSGLTPYVQQGTGLGNTAASGLTGAGVGAVRGVVSGQGAGQGAASGLIGGLAGSTAAKDYAGQLFGNYGGAALGAGAGAANGLISGRGAAGGAISGGAGAALGAGFNSLTGGGNSSSNGGGSTPMSMDYTTNDPMNYDVGGNGTADWGSSASAGNGNGGLGGWTDPNTGQSYDYSGNNLPTGYGNPTGNGGGSSGGGSSMGGTSGLLGKLFGGTTSGNGILGGNGLGLLGGLMGMGLSYAGGSQQLAAQRQAAGQYAQNTRFSPYGMSGPGGTTSFKNGVGSFSLSPQNATQYRNLQNLGTMADSNLMHTGDSVGGYRGMNANVVGAGNNATAAGRNPLFSNVNGSGYNGLLNTMGNNAQSLTGQAGQMAGGLTQDAQNHDMQSQYDMLQNRDRQANNRFMSGNLDSEFANGTLASTAGQYQTQGALDALNTRSTNNALTAQNFALQNMGARVGAFNAVGGQGNQDASQFQNLGQNQYSQNFNNNQTGYNRATDAFGRAMSMFSGGNQNANANAQTYSGLLGQSQNGIQNYNNFGNNSVALGGQLGSEQSSANSRAFLPQVTANGQSANGTFLSSLGNSFQNPYNPYGGY